MSTEQASIDLIVKILRRYFDRFEAPYYVEKMDPIEMKSYKAVARRKFVKYYMVNQLHGLENIFKDYK